MSKSLVLKRHEEVEENGLTLQRVTYEGVHSSGPPNGTRLTFTVELKRFRHSQWEASLVFDGCAANTPVQALQRLAEWTSRAAEALEEVKDEEWANHGLPLGKVYF